MRDPMGRLAAAAVVAGLLGAVSFGAASSGAVSSGAVSSGAVSFGAASSGAAAERLAAHPEAPPTGHTGGFGEPTCQRCHFDYALDEPGGVLRLDGLPGAYDAAATYRLQVVLTHPELRTAGFELAARFADGERAGQPAGRVAAVDERVAVVRDTAGVAYVLHTKAGTVPAAPGSAAWAFEWTPPADGGRVVFHAAANASNDDASAFGDRIYVLEHAVAPAPRP